MAKVIQFYVPASFHWKLKWVSSHQRGKVIQFLRDARKSA